MRVHIRILKHIVAAIGYGLVGGFILGLILYVYYLQNRPPLKAWHTIELDEEFGAPRAGEVKDLAGYLRLEERLFDELRREIDARVAPADRHALSRFNPESVAHPENYPSNWNRTFELAADEPRAGVLLLHGLSDSPYSVRTLAESLHDHGAWVLGLRVPGHGTAPTGLTDITWQDFAAAARIAAVHVAKQVGEERPFYIVGYSNGAALAVQYSLAALAGEPLPLPDGLLLLSPAIGITRAAALAVWQARLSHVTGLEKLAWDSILPEYDPFKYNSFPINAGEQMYQLTLEIASRAERLNQGSGVKGFPPVLAFQSLVDATVIPAALVDRLLRQLAPEGHELVLFDVNRIAAAKPFLRAGKEQLREQLLADGTLPFTLTLVTNQDERSRGVMARQKPPHSMATKDTPLDLVWPKDVYSLAHVALPFPPDDSLYGYAAPDDGGLHLGSLEMRGENGLLLVKPGQMLRLRSNPFFPYLQRRMLEFFQLTGED
jgi:alpha-beta hydrolase superfamily lysophospholipase